jgi:hypothetical protein
LHEEPTEGKGVHSTTRGQAQKIVGVGGNSKRIAKEETDAEENSHGSDQISQHSKELEKRTSQICEAKALDQVKPHIVLFKIGDHVYGTVTGSPDGIAEFIELLGGVLSGKGNSS